MTIVRLITRATLSMGEKTQKYQKAERQMPEEYEINRIMTKYCWAMDRSDWKGWLNLFDLQDGVWKGDAGSFRGIEALSRIMSILAQKLLNDPSRHVLHNILIDVDGKSARVRCYASALRVPSREIAYFGEYDVIMSKLTGSWLIQSIEFTTLN
jgi:hypothetical protein